MNDYTFRILGEGDLSEMNSLFEIAFNMEVKDNFLDWKYFLNPAGKAIIIGAFYQNKLVCSGAMVPTKMSVFGNIKTTYLHTDLMTHPEHQRKGLAKRIGELLIEHSKQTNTPFLYAIGARLSTHIFLKNNWRLIGGMVNFFKPYFYLKLIKTFQSKKKSTIQIHDSIANHLDKFQFKIESYKIRIHKTADYLRWRTSNPNFAYKIICSYDKNNLVNGYLIYSIAKNNLIYVIDVENEPNNPTILKNLIDGVEREVIEYKYKGVVILTIKNSDFFNLIKNKYYFRNPFNKGPLKSFLDFTIYPYGEEVELISAMKNWDILGLSYDDI
jgi:GNAT superfamily N-acetyltransferase